MINKEKKVIFIHVPKCGGLSIKKLFNFPGPRHNTLRYHLKKHKKECEEFFKFSIVRNPWDRAVSWYSYHSTQKCRKTAICYQKSFEQWVKDGCISHWTNVDGTQWGDKTGNNPMNQHEFLINEKGKIGIDKIIKLENIEKELEILKKTFGIEGKTPKVNKSKRPKKNYKLMYDEEMKDIIYKKFNKDINLFNYDF